MLIAAIAKELKLLARDLHGVAVLFVMPIVFMLIMSAALSQDGDNLRPDARIVLLGDADDANTRDLSAALRGEGWNVATAAHGEAAAQQRALQNGRTDLLIDNPNRADTPLADEQPLHLWLSPDADRAWLAAAKGILRQHYTRIRLDRYLAEQRITLPKNPRFPVRDIERKANASFDQTRDAVKQYLAQTAWRETYLNRRGEAVQRPNSVQHSVPAWLIFGMFFIMIPLSNVMTAERQTNTLTRLSMARAPASALLAAKIIPYFLINQLQFVGMVLLGYTVLPALDMPAFALSGSLAPYLLLSAAVSAAALGYGLLVSVLARSTEQAVVLGGGGIIIMAALGGIMVPVHVMPDIMRQIAAYSPMGWGLEAFQKLLLNHYSAAQIAPQLLKLSCFGCAALCVAVWLYRRQLALSARF
ncbi:ABC transporter permease [Conchiformibius kuhniae]|uniref:ABC transporter permease n=1 Tax=Conchiformibius kuhniae TaxID=211502 RepID=A0A8T9MZ76_9NEIS|nr:ABC transporter permease [Conchiformibius kuhniae]UOP05502.1 ABC transporter permease [Conchiformibius kuhniae]